MQGGGRYGGGRLGRSVPAEAAEVTLRLPPPIGRPLDVERDDDGAVLRDGDSVVAEARPTSVAADAPSPVDAGEATAAAVGSPFLEVDMHPFPTCFVCGPKRTPGDGLRIFSGPVAQRDVFAAPWTPDPALAGDDGRLPSEVGLGAIECPTSATVADDAGW